jgi:hypothetical protein
MTLIRLIQTLPDPAVGQAPRVLGVDEFRRPLLVFGDSSRADLLVPIPRDLAPAEQLGHRCASNVVTGMSAPDAPRARTDRD